MKYWIYIVTVLFFISLFFVFSDTKKEATETRAVYFSYIEFSKYITDKTEEESKRNIETILDNLKNYNYNRIIVHVRPFSDSMYKSSVYPVSSYVLNKDGEYPNYDLLKYFIDEAHKRKIKFDAWINPYRISNYNDTNNINKDSIYHKYKNTDVVKVLDNGIYLNPASKDAQNLIVEGIIEIVKDYDVDGIHFDDYFYPDKTIDLETFEKYKSSGGNLTIEEYRYGNVKELIKRVYKEIKSIDNRVEFGIAPQGNIDNCYEESYLDVREILNSNEYVDYIMPQIYFGFDNKTRPFIKTVNEWSSLIKNENIKLIPALAMYKTGQYDKYAIDGANEWINNTDIIKREVTEARLVTNYHGFSLFSYNYLFNDNYQNDNTKEEINNLNQIIKDE